MKVSKFLVIVAITVSVLALTAQAASGQHLPANQVQLRRRFLSRLARAISNGASKMKAKVKGSPKPSTAAQPSTMARQSSGTSAGGISRQSSASSSTASSLPRQNSGTQLPNQQSGQALPRQRSSSPGPAAATTSTTSSGAQAAAAAPNGAQAGVVAAEQGKRGFRTRALVGAGIGGAVVGGTGVALMQSGGQGSSVQGMETVDSQFDEAVSVDDFNLNSETTVN